MCLLTDYNRKIIFLGAIKFGDPLNRQQCTQLVNYWRETDLPNRCAHGRPAIIPLLLIDLKNQNNPTFKVRLIILFPIIIPNIF